MHLKPAANSCLFFRLLPNGKSEISKMEMKRKKNNIKRKQLNVLNSTAGIVQN